MSKEREEECCKVILLGEMSVGKTCIISQLIHKSFDNSVTTTIGASSSSITISIDANHTERFEIWDTSGQERYRSLTKLYYKDASAVIMVYDITQLSSFKEIQNYWLSEVTANSDDDIIIALAANKSDLYEHEQVDEKDGRQFAQSMGLLFHQTSAKNGAGIEKVFRSIGEKYLGVKEKKLLKKKKEPKKNVKLSSKECPQITEKRVEKNKCC